MYTPSIEDLRVLKQESAKKKKEKKMVQFAFPIRKLLKIKMRSQVSGVIYRVINRAPTHSMQNHIS